MAESSQKCACRVTWEGDCNPSWLEIPLPNSPKDKEHLHQLLDFFLVQSPCRFQSNRRRSIEDEWGIGGRLTDKSMKERLDAIVFDGASNILIKDSKKTWCKSLPIEILGMISIGTSIDKSPYSHRRTIVATPIPT